MGKEIELKLAVRPDQQGRLSRHPLLTHAASRQTSKLVNIYYDTPDLLLHRHGIALRLRQDGRQWLQTVKCAGESTAGLSARPEWEIPYRNAFDFSAIDDPKVRKLLHQVQARLGPAFETNFKRITWQVRDKTGGHVLVTLDKGEIVAAGKRAFISEVELELAQGKVASLFAIATSLGSTIALTPALLSKAERGYRLFLQLPEAPVKATQVPLTKTMPPLAAFRAIALGCLEHLQHNQAAAIDGKDPEYVHQMRVASRRLDAALRFFKPLLPAETHGALRAGLKQLLKSLGRARDMDVLLTEIIAPVLAETPRAAGLSRLADSLRNEQHQAQQQVAAYLASPAYGHFLLQGIQLIHRLVPNDGRQAPEKSELVHLEDYAGERVQKLMKEVFRRGVQANLEDPAALHALRIRIKHLRYTRDFLASLSLPNPLPIRRIGRLQDQLGWLNDLTNAGPVLLAHAQTDPSLLTAVAKIGAWHIPSYRKTTKKVAKQLRGLRTKCKGKYSWI